MNNRKKLVLFLIILGTFFLGYFSSKFTGKKNQYIPPLEIVGDILNPEIKRELFEKMEDIKVEEDREKIKALKLEEVILKSEPISDENEIVLVGQDGLTSKIDGETLENSYLSFNSEYGWEVINLNHPPSSNIKDLNRIIIISKEDSLDIGVNIIKDDENIKNLRIGKLHNENRRILPYFEGISEMEKDGNSLSVEVRKEKIIFQMTEILKDINWNKGIAVSKLGEIKEIKRDGYLELGLNTMDYVSSDGKERLEDIVGIILDPPENKITDAYNDISNFLEDENVLFLFVDGFGYHQYEYAFKNNKVPYLASQEKAKKALSVYKPVTNAGFAAMITGKLPIDNGVHSHNEREFKGDSIFKYVKDIGKKGVLIEGDIGILKTEIEPKLNIDRNKDGSMDDEILESALEHMKEDNNLVFVHFKEIDYTGHSHGDFGKETIKVISKTDEYIEKLVSNWKGKVIITSDHGMHNTVDGGNHGEFRYEDMIVPYLILEGGL